MCIRDRYISKYTINKYLKEVCSTTQKDHIPRICNEYIHKYKFAEENDIESGMLFELSSVNYKNNSFNIPKISIPESGEIDTPKPKTSIREKNLHRSNSYENNITKTYIHDSSLPSSSRNRTQPIDVFDTFTRNSSFGSEDNNTQAKHLSLIHI